MESASAHCTVTMHEHIINMSKDHTIASSSNANSHNNNNSEEEEELPDGDGERGLPSSSSSSDPSIPNLQNTTLPRSGESLHRRQLSPLNSALWISIELMVNLSQIVAAVMVLSLSKHERHVPLFEWVIGYTAGCVATLPHLYWRYVHRNHQGSNQEAAYTARDSSSSQNNSINQTETNSYTAVSRSNSRLEGAWRRNVIIRNPRVHALVGHFKMALDCFFLVWFVVGLVCIFGGISSFSDAPNLYRLCLAFLMICYIGYPMLFILCAMIFCCLLRIISLMLFRENINHLLGELNHLFEDLNHIRGATQESINALPIYKFRLEGTRTNNERHSSEINLDNHSADDGGTVGVGTDMERMISAEDAVCCICLAKYDDNDELRELPCTHLFHKECVDKWLKINALCPLCKAEVPNNSSAGLLGLSAAWP